MHMKTLLPAIILCVTSSLSTYADDTAIAIKDGAYSPENITVSAGTKVTWTNYDDDAHSVSEATKPVLFHSAALDTKETYSYTFSTPGVYPYFCTLHPEMTGSITVK